MKNYKLHTSEGFKDTYGKEILVKKEIENSVLACFKSFGLEYIKTPGVEYIDVYSDKGIQKPDLYNLINHQGEVLALCNDMTASIARFVAANNILAPVKYCYSADTFRYPRLYQGKSHQFLQAGIELVGEENIESDIEAIYIAHKVLNKLNINNYSIHLGSSRFLELLFEDYKINDSLKKEIYRYIEHKDYVSLSNLLKNNLEEKNYKFLFDLMLKGGKLRFIENLIKDLKDSKALSEALYLKDIYNTLKELGVENIIFDFSIYPYATYYTGIIFDVYLENASKSIISGGRCNVFKSFGLDYSDIGFGLDIDVLTQYALDTDLIKIDSERYLSFSDEESYVFSLKTNDSFREQGIIVNDLKFKSLDEALKYAKDNGYSKVIHYTKNSFKLLEV